jgi:YD repeat-containing protein
MNPTQYGTWPSDACTLGPSGSYGPDRITKTIYDAAGQARQEIRAFGTSAQQVYATHKFEPDGQEIAIADSDAGIQIGVSYADALNATAAAPHQTNYAYDGFDRLVTTTYADNTTDQVTSYDSDSNALTHVNRAGQSLTYTFDKLDRMATKAVPAAGAIPANALTWTYDLINEVTNLSDTNGNVLANTWDMAGRALTAVQTLPGMASAGRGPSLTPTTTAQATRSTAPRSPGPTGTS